MDAFESVVRKFSYPLAAVGIYTLSVWMYQTFCAFVEIAWGVWKEHSVKEDLINRYGRWAVISGGSDGIGKQCSLFWASKGLNIVIIAKPDRHLDLTTQEILGKFKVQVKKIPVDFAEGFDLSDHLKKEIGNLDIGVLVNNVGTAPRNGNDFTAFSLDSHRLLIHVNFCAAVMLTHIILPGMKQRRRGLVVNMSSLFGLTPVPHLLTYGATKAFMYSFSETLRHELKPFSVECQTVTPLIVSTEMTKVIRSKNLLLRLLEVSADSYGRWLTMTFGKTARTTGYWAHGVELTLMKLLPVGLLTFIYSKSTKV